MNLKGDKTANIDVKGRIVFGPTNMTKGKVKPTITPTDLERIADEWRGFISALIYISNFSTDPVAVSYAERALWESEAYRKLVQVQEQEEQDASAEAAD